MENKKIETYYDVKSIKNHFQIELLDSISSKVYKIKIEDEDRNEATYKAEDAGFQRCKDWVMNILEKEMSKLR